ncbi:MAG: DJ-1 family glyoxalase III [Anaerovoracaceae bacterium]|jgi:4-methyl-5(b-hydroxyethyl)-thiazole monophosphate biosynthesis
MSVYVHLATGFEEVEALTVVDILRRAEINVETVSVTGDRLVLGTHDIPVQADILIENGDYENCEMMVFPGGFTGTTNMANHEGLLMRLREFTDKQKWVAAICAAPMILGELGLLDGKEATCYPGLERHLFGATIKSDNVVVYENYITSKGPATAMEFAVKIVEVLKGREIAQEIADALLMNQ